MHQIPNIFFRPPRDQALANPDEEVENESRPYAETMLMLASIPLATVNNIPVSYNFNFITRSQAEDGPPNAAENPHICATPQAAISDSVECTAVAMPNVWTEMEVGSTPPRIADWMDDKFRPLL